MALFDVPLRADTRASDSALVKKANKKPKQNNTVVSKGTGIMGTISTIVSTTERYLGQFKDDSILIQDEQTLISYIDKCLENKVIAIDTETTGLDPLKDTLVGICIYTPDEKGAYIPVNHISYITLAKVDGQLPVDILHREFQRIADANMDRIMFNGPFDVRFMRSGIGVNLVCTWDCYPAARLLNENEGDGNNSLKKLHQKYVLNDKEDAFSFGELFKGVTFDKIPLKVAYLYGAHDPKITYELYQFQLPYLTPDNELCIKHNLQDVAWVFHHIEMPTVMVVADMEDNGITFDKEYNQELSIKYNALLNDKLDVFNNELGNYQQEISSYIMQNPNSGLENPVNINSPKQLGILLYDIFQLESPDPKNPRGTGEDILSKIDHPICRAILDYRGLTKLIGTYIDKMPLCVNSKDNRVHCKFNQYGADTGRFSSSEPNMQNIPSHNHDIRKMFTAAPGYVLMSSDFSQQEPKCLAALCRQQGDPQMYNTFMEGKDLYSEIASKAFNKSYDDCREFRADGTTNKEGKARRTQAKSILLGVLYGRGVPSIAEQLNTTTEKAQQIKDSVFQGFPAIKQFEEDSLNMARELGYVTTVCGRKRRLPDLQLPEYSFTWKNGVPPVIDPLDFDDEDIGVPEGLIKLYTQKLKNCRFGNKPKIIAEAREQHHINITDNGGKIAQATRQCVNARIQGSAADLTKLAMIDLVNSKELKELGFRLLIPVHDEVIAECPLENAKRCSELLAETMSKAAEKILQMPIKCDVEITREWYGEEIKLDET